MAYTNTTRRRSAPLQFRLFGGLFLRPPWNTEAAERPALDNQLWRGWKIQFISPLLLLKRPLEQEMTVDVLIFKRWAPHSLRQDGGICSNVTELSSRLSSLCKVVFFTHTGIPRPDKKFFQWIKRTKQKIFLMYLQYLDIYKFIPADRQTQLPWKDWQITSSLEATALSGNTIKTQTPCHLSSLTSYCLPTALSGNLQKWPDIQLQPNTPSRSASLPLRLSHSQKSSVAVSLPRMKETLVWRYRRHSAKWSVSGPKSDENWLNLSLSITATVQR